ncbi:MAG TPA: helix-turn-helix domain-containing protein [Ktedonosporobacter sp.]|nr:helix-turn-helix domain-containing protein [Ktedonosporobacter sp.]
MQGEAADRSFGALLSQFRVQRRLNQLGLARKLGMRTRNTVSAWERNLYLPDGRHKVIQLAEALDLDENQRNQLLFAADFALEPQMLPEVPVTTTHFQATSDVPSLQDYIITPDAVFERVQVRDFVGRQWLEDDLNAFLHDPVRDRGAWLLVGEAGIGKTAFLAHLVQTHPDYLSLFAEQAPGVGNLPSAIQSLAAQLITRFRLEPYASQETLPQFVSMRPEFLSRLLHMVSEQLKAGEKAIIVLDGLDEAGVSPEGTH